MEKGFLARGRDSLFLFYDYCFDFKILSIPLIHQNGQDHGMVHILVYCISRCGVLLGALIGKSKHPLENHKFQKNAEWDVFPDGGAFVARQNNGSVFCWVNKKSNNLTDALHRIWFKTEDEAIARIIEIQEANILPEKK